MDMGDFVVIVNAEKVVVSGNKYNDKTYFRHTNGRPGHYKIEAFKDLQKVGTLNSCFVQLGLQWISVLSTS